MPSRAVKFEPGQISERVARLPVDLFRHELMMTLQPVADEVIEEIVDDGFLAAGQAGCRRNVMIGTPT